MLRIITLNLNGIRSAASKGLLEWLAAQKADVVCLQEVKAQLPDIAPALLNPHPYAGHFSCAEKKAIAASACIAANRRTRSSPASAPGNSMPKAATCAPISAI